MAASTKQKDKYIVSFNSDTSDSEDESDNDVKPSPKKPLPGGPDKEKPAPVLMNGHVGHRQNGDVGEGLAVTSTLNKTSKSAGDKPVDTLKDCTPSPRVNGSLLDLDSFTVKRDSSKTERGPEPASKGESKGLGVKTGASKSEISSSFDLLSSDRSRGSDYNSATRKGKPSNSNDLESAYSRAKEKNSYLARSSGQNMDQDKSNLLIDFSEASDNFESTTSKVGRSEAKITQPMPKPGLQKSYSSEFEAEMANIFDKGSKSGPEPIFNGETPIDFRDAEVKKHEPSGNFDFDADLLIYASPGTTAPKSKFNFDLEGKTDNGPKRSVALEGDNLDEKPFRRQNSKPDERESLLSPKEKYRNLDEKFSAICSKYGRDTKREIPQERTKTAEEDDTDIYGTVKVKTTKQETSAPSLRSRYDDDEDLGFSEDKTSKQKMTFDDVVSWKKGSTDDLIQRILADARNESSVPKTGITKDREPRDYAPGAENRFAKPEPYEKDMGGDRMYDYGQAQPSLLERRLAALGGQDKQQSEELDLYSRPKRHTELEPYGRPKTSYQDDSEQFYKRKTRGSSAHRDDVDAYSVKTRGSSAHRDDVDAYSVGSGEVGRYIPWKERQRSAYNDDEDDLSCGASACGYQSHLLRAPARYDADSESDDESYRSSRARDPMLPDEWFTPQRHDETDVIVRERTMEVRNMVDNQTEVLGRLKKAADSFSDLDAEIRALKQQCIENQVARQAIIEDILQDMKDDAPLDDDPVPTPRRYTRGSYKSPDSYSSKYSSSYTPSYDYSRSREGSAYRSLDGDSDRLGGYALGSVAKSKWGEPGGSRAFRSASVSRFDNVEKEHSYDKYGLYNSKRSMRAGSCVDDYDGRSEYSVGDRGDEGDTASVRSFHSDKNTEDAKEEDSKSSYRSRQTPKYGSYLTPVTTYDTPSYSRYSSSTREARSPTRRTATSTSDISYDRPRTRGMSLPPPEKPFTSRFLSKVREKKASGVDVSSSRDKPFKSRFLTRSFDSDYHSGSSSRGSLASTPDRNSYTSSSTRTYSSRKRDTDTSGAGSEGSEATAVTAE